MKTNLKYKLNKYLCLEEQDCLLVTLIERKKMKTLIKVVALAVTLAVATSVDAQVKPDKGPKGKDKVTHRDGKKPSKEDIKKRWEAAKKKRAEKQKDAKKRGSKVSERKNSPRGRSFGRLVRSDDKLAGLVKEWRGKEAELKKKSRALWEKLKKSDDDDAKAKLRAALGELRKSHGDASKKHREEIGARLKELGKDGVFKNDRKKLLDNERKGERRRRGKPGE
jgi:hypothetical protein